MKYRNLFPEQMYAFNMALKHVTGFTGKQELIINAPAGSGKSYMISALRELLDTFIIPASYIAYTGRAASRINGGTIHSMFYTPILNENGDVISWTRRPNDEILTTAGRCIIVDESSMIPYGIYKDIINVGIPVIFIGDNAQLPPIDKDNEDFNAMFIDDALHVTLKKMRRFGPESGIAKISENLRNDPSIPRIKSNDVKFVSKADVKKVKFFKENEIDAVVVGTNKTRAMFNRIIRGSKGFYEDTPQIGERVMCLKNTVRGNRRINNGGLYIVESIFPSSYDDAKQYIMRNIEKEDYIVSVIVSDETWETEKPVFTKDAELKEIADVFGFGYAMTCHKVQGSGFENVLYFDEDVSFFLDQQKFRYTAVTRAEKKLYVAI